MGAALDAALARERSIREQAFFPVPEIILGVESLPLTCRQFAILCHLESPFVTGSDYITPEHCCAFLWLVSPLYRPGNSMLTRWRRRRFTRRIAGLNYCDVKDAIKRYVSDAFEDAPESSGGRKSIPPISFLATVVHMLAKNYGWTENEILDCPLKRVWQYMRRIELDADPDAFFINTSDAVRKQERIAQ